MQRPGGEVSVLALKDPNEFPIGLPDGAFLPESYLTLTRRALSPSISSRICLFWSLQETLLMVPCFSVKEDFNHPESKFWYHTHGIELELCLHLP